MTALLTEIISLLVSGITGIASGIGTGLSTLVKDIFVTTAEGGAMTLSTFGGLIVVFAGISLAIGLCRLVVHWLSTLGASNV